jgi:hypothetical protein
MFLILQIQLKITAYILKEHNMDKACSTHGGGDNACRIVVGDLKRREHLGGMGRDGEDNIKMIQYGGGNCIHLDQDRDQWRAVLNAVMNLQDH